MLTWELTERVMKPWLRPRAFLERCLTRFYEALLFGYRGPRRDPDK
jgi:hypothetical protein